MKAKHTMSVVLAALMVSSIFIPAVQAGESSGIEISASIKEPRPEIGITVDVDHISFGELLPGEASSSYPVEVTNVGLKLIDVSTTVADEGTEDIFIQGITVNGGAWSEYSSQLVSDDSDSFDVTLYIPETIVTRGNISGSLTVWAEAANFPVADFTSSVTSYLAPLTVHFADNSTNSPTAWLWDFGDGTNGTEQNPVHTYASLGTYAVSLTATSSDGSTTVTKEVTIVGPYSTALANTNPGAPDPGIPGFVGPDGAGVITSQRLSGATPTNNQVNPTFVAWATQVIDYYRSDGETAFSYPSAALGPVTGSNFDVVSLGDLDQAMIDAGERPGSITLGFDVAIVNGPGPDFAAFENGFIVAGTTLIFAELGYVEVSTDGVTFARFPSVSLTSGEAGGYGSIDAAYVYNLVGKHVNAYGDSWGTPFDLSDLANAPEVLNGSVDLNNINYVRIVDVPGSGHFLDSRGNPIYDAWVTFGSGGVDFEALGVINAQPKAFDAFSADVTTGDAPLTVHFTDKCVNATSWAWDFDNDGVVDSTEQNPTYIYNTPGTYTVRLNVTYAEGSDEWVKTSCIIVNMPSSAGFAYTSNGSAITITGYKGPGGSAVIPGEIDGLPVTSIGSTAFFGCTNMTSVVVPKSVTSIGTYAFYGCTALTSVAIGNGVTGIGTSAFQSCIALTSVTIGSGVTSIGASAFQGCTALTSVAIPDSVTTMGQKAFQGCTALTSVAIGSGVTSIGDSAFYNCVSLTSVAIPDSVTGIGTSAFQSCIALTSVAIGSGVTSLPDGAFSGCTNLASVTIGSGVTGIGSGTFQDCTNLTSVTLPDRVTSIVSEGFYGCTALTAINVDANNTVYASVDGVVYNKNVTTLMIWPAGKLSVIIPSSVTSIGDYAFSGIALTSIVIPNSVTSIGRSAFSGCTALTSIVIPDSVTDIGNNSFGSCTALSSVTLGSGVKTIGNYAFYKCTALTSVTIPDNVTGIGDGLFYGCTALASIEIPNSVTSIGYGTFYSCTALTSIVIPDSVIGIGQSAFSGCTNLASVTIGSGVTSISVDRFDGCTALTAININANNTAYSSIDGVVYNKAVTTLIYCPLGKVSVTIPDSVTSIATWAFNGCTNLASVTIGSGVTSIGSYAFQKCTALTSVMIPHNVTSIGQSAFAGCTALTSMVFVGNAPTVGANWVQGAVDLVVYYNEGATGFTTPEWNGVPCYPAVAPVADFSADAVSGDAPLTVQFTDQSVGANTWSWDFNGDGVADSTVKNPAWTFEAPGTYTVTLTVINPFGSDEEVKTDYITVTVGGG